MRHKLIENLANLLIDAEYFSQNGNYEKSLSLKRKFSEISEKSNLTDAEYFELNEKYLNFESSN